MKQLERLQTLVEKMTQNEKTQFKRYCAFKLKRKPLTLFNLLIKHKESPAELLHAAIKRNKLHTNLRYTVNLAIDLILSYWDENIEDSDRIRKINKMINQAKILRAKGLLQEADNLLEEVIEITENTVNLEQTLLAKRVLHAFKASLETKNNFQLSEDFIEYQTKTMERIAAFNECESLYVNGMYLQGKGQTSLTKHEIKLMLEMRDRGKVLFDNLELPVSLSVKLGALLADFCCRLAPLDYKLAEFYHIKNLERVKALKDCYNRAYYYNAIFGYLAFLSHMKRKEDFTILRLDLMEAKSKTKTKDVLISGILQIMTLFGYLLDYDLEKADEATNEAKVYIQAHTHEVIPAIVKNISFISFELAMIKGDLEQADLFLEQQKEMKVYLKTKKEKKLTIRLATLLVHYERNNHELILNQSDSIRRLFSDLLKKSIGSNLLLKLLVQLSSAISKKEKKRLYTEFLQKLNTLYEQHPEQRFLFYFDIIEDWALAKLNGYKTILEYKNALQK